MIARRSTLLILATVAVMFGFTSVARGQAKLKIGIVDLQRAIYETEDGKRAKTQLESIFKKKQEELKKKQDELEKGKTDYEAKRLLMTPEARGRAEQDLQQRLVEFQGALVENQKELNKRQAEVMKKILEKMEKVLVVIGQQQEFSVILNKGEDNILFGQPSLDLTNEVIRRYNEIK